MYGKGATEPVDWLVILNDFAFMNLFNKISISKKLGNYNIGTLGQNLRTIF